MALADFRFRKTNASATLDFLNDRLPSAATITDQAGGQVVTVNVDDTAEADLVDVMAELGFTLIEGTGGAGVTGTSYDDNEQRRDLIKSPVRVRTDSDLITGGWTPSGSGKNKILTSPSTATGNNDFDGVTFTAGVDQRVLLTGIGTHNGIYFLEQAADGASDSAILKRAYDADEDAEVKSGMQVSAVEGSSARKIFLLTTTGTITVDTTSLTFEAVRDEVDATENMLFGAGSVGSSTTTRYLFPCYSDSIAQTTPVQFRAARAGTLQNLRVRHNTAGGNGNAIVYTIRINGVGSSLTVSMLSTASDGSDLVNTAAVSAGDLIDVIVTKASTVGGGVKDVIASVEFA
jgi:copper chaperone CopZ